MKKLILAFIALAVAFAISSCCCQGQGLGRQREMEKEEEECRQAKKHSRQQSRSEEAFSLEVVPEEKPQMHSDAPERQHHRW